MKTPTLTKGEFSCLLKEEVRVGHTSVIVSDVSGGMLPYEFFVNFIVDEDEHRCLSGTIRVQEGMRVPATVVMEQGAEEAILHL